MILPFSPSRTLSDFPSERSLTTNSCFRGSRIEPRGESARRRTSSLTTTYDVVAVLAEALCQRIGEPRYNLWFAGKTRFVCKDEQVTVGVPNLFLQDWLQKKFADEVQAAAVEVLGAGASLRFVIDP